jgi:hypothetical protein
MVLFVPHHAKAWCYLFRTTLKHGVILQIQFSNDVTRRPLAGVKREFTTIFPG